MYLRAPRVSASISGTLLTPLLLALMDVFVFSFVVEAQNSEGRKEIKNGIKMIYLVGGGSM